MIAGKVLVSQKVVEFVAARMAIANCAAHDINHCFRVANLSESIARKESGTNVKVAYYGGLLHDVMDHKLYGPEGTEATKTELLALLTEDSSLTASDVTTIFEIINNVGYKNMIRPRTDFDPFALSTEYRCVQDADLLDAIGAIGVARCYAYTGRTNAKMFGGPVVSGALTVTREQYLLSQQSKDASAVGHFFEKLLRIKDLIMTEEGKRLAAARHANMVAFLQQLDEELIGAGDVSGGVITNTIPHFIV